VAEVRQRAAEQVNRRRRPGRGRWRTFALQGDYHKAFDALQQEAKQRRERLDHLVHDETRDLFLAADSARHSGHPAKAVPFLRRILRTHRDDARADLAAFTLGRVLLALQRPAQAARAFEQARVLGGDNGALSEDALAREVESWAGAGQWNRVRRAAAQYLKTYPRGRRAASVQRYAAQSARQVDADASR
jgi:tetratricopeptide (TPR) repeat protein